MPEWPEWILEVLISNFEVGSNKVQNGIGIKDIEAIIHCAEWLAMIDGLSTEEQRIRCEESLPKTLYDPFREGTVFVRRF